MRPAAFIEKLYADNKAFYSDDRGKGALKDLQMVFPMPWIYLAELVQNAIDAKATRIRFTPGVEGNLVFEHNGSSFSQEDVRALCMRGVSTKSTNTVGFMGVGFKSVFKAYEKAVVSSGPWRFELCVPSDDMFGVRQWLGAVLPVWAADARPPADGFTCRFEFIGRVIDGNCTEDLAQLLREGEALLPLLAWNRVAEVQVGSQSWALSVHETPISGGDGSKVRVDANSHDGSRRSWVLFVKTYEPSQDAVLRFLRHRQIQPETTEKEAVLTKARRPREVILFCEVATDGSPVPVERGQCFSLVPLGQTTCIGLHMQAEWLLDISRREPMRIAGDPWQEQILEQVPELLKSYLEWLVSDETGSGGSWARGYEALPGASAGTEIDVALSSGYVARRLTALLSDCEFVPYDAGDSKVNFTTPSDARVLPHPLQQTTTGEKAVPSELFGSRIVVPETLGRRAATFLTSLRLLLPLSPDELKAEWQAGKVREWYNTEQEGAQPAYTRLIGALADLDADPAWAATDLRCLPAADGEWRSRSELRRYPQNWGILGPSAKVAVALEPFAGTTDALLDWKADQALRRDLTSQRYLEHLDGRGLDEVAAAWWASLTTEIVSSDREIVIEWTDLVRRQKNLPGLVLKVLAVTDHTEQLLPIENAILADPYAGSYRRDLFPTSPRISEVYLTDVSGGSDADWRAFFEGQEPSPGGRPHLYFVRSEATQQQLASLPVVSRRVTFKSSEWRGLKVDSRAYYIADTKWPEQATAVLNAATEPGSIALQRWMVERPGLFTDYSHP